jgi:hypothetical protein
MEDAQFAAAAYHVGLYTSSELAPDFIDTFFLLK